MPGKKAAQRGVNSVLVPHSFMMMWRLVIVSTVVWPSSCDFSSNADSRARSKFPVALVADTGAPKEGEGAGGVAVLLKPMPEATTMKTWSFLKESMQKIGDQVKQIMEVRNDMAMLQQDLTLQEKLWQQAEIELNQENAKLRAELGALKKQEKEGSKVKHELLKAKQSLEEVQRQTDDLNNEAAMQEKKWKMEVEFLDARKNNVTALHKEVNETASKEISRVNAVNLQMQKDGATLKLASEDFQDRLKNGQEKMEFEHKKSMAQEGELKRQISAMKEGLIRIQSKLRPRELFDKEDAQLKDGLQKETSDILALQSEHQQMVTECTKRMQEQDSIKCAEEAKLRSRLAEKTQFCNAIQVQNQVLKQDLMKCDSTIKLVNTMPLAQASTAPMTPLAPPVAMNDPELAPIPAMSFAPAPALMSM
jgi:hypothetical protein